MTKPLTIAVVSDVICPWCYLGKRRLERALAELDQPAEIQWLPYELNPDMPPEGMERASYREQKFGAARAAQFDAQLTALGQEEGVPFAFERQARTPNTRRAHQLIAFAASEGKADAVVEGLFKAYFEDGRDIGSEETLSEVAAEAGLDRGVALAAIRDEGLRAYVADLERQAASLGIQGVPFFVLDRRYGLAGAQPPEMLVAAIERTRADRAAEPGS
jgi:predicted DsbA family dithiol-disulfide isomerase